MRGPVLLVLLLNLTCLCTVVAQDTPSSLGKLVNFLSRFTDHINKKSEQLEEKLVQQAEKYFQRLAGRDEKLREKLAITFKKTKMQLLWDFLSYQQIPRA